MGPLCLLVFILGALISSSLCQDEDVYLQFVTLGTSASHVPEVNDGTSGAIIIRGGLPLGNSTQTIVYVGTNGLISFGAAVSSASSPAFSPISGTTDVVAPFWADIDITTAGSISYTVYTSSNGSLELSNMSTFIHSKTGTPPFSGSWMIVAEWNGVAQYGGSDSTTNTFQAAVITDGSTSYAVFTYRCGSMEWSGNAAIGFKASGSTYRNHPLSKSNDSNLIACANSHPSGWSNVVYRITSVEYCFSSDFGCNNGGCVDFHDRCDGDIDCGDISDEEFCTVTATCHSGDFQCDSGGCIPDPLKCDGSNDCYDNSDEDCVNYLLAVTIVLSVIAVFLSLLVCCNVMSAAIYHSTTKNATSSPSSQTTDAAIPMSSLRVAGMTETVHQNSYHPQSQTQPEAFSAPIAPPEEFGFSHGLFTSGHCN